MKLLLEEAKRPRPRYVPARAGWNGPEEKSAVNIPNPTYDELRREPSAAEVRRQLLATAIPDWRIVFAILALIGILRTSLHGTRRATQEVGLAPLLAFPESAPTSAASEAA